MQAARNTVADVISPVNEWLYVTPLSDLHCEHRDFDSLALKRLMEERNAMGQHLVFILGDALDLVVPPDMKRYMAGNKVEALTARQDWAQASVERGAEVLRSCGLGGRLLGIGRGNHETAFLKHHGFDLSSALAQELRCPVLGYSGYITLALMDKPGGKRRAPLFRILFHHGRGGGRVQKGYGWARDWCRTFADWRVFVYGHNHQMHAHPEVVIRPTKRGGITRDTRYIVNTGTFLEGYPEDAHRTVYSEVQGHRPTVISAPLLKIRQRKTSRSGWSTEVRVEV